MGEALWRDDGLGGGARGGPLRVLHFISSTRDFRPFFRGLARACAHGSVKFSLCTMEPYGELHRELAALGCGAGSLGLSGSADHARALSRLQQFLAAERPQVLHLHLFWPSLVGLVAARAVRPRPACVVTRHYSDFKHTQIESRVTRSVYLALERLLNRMTDRLIVLSELTEHVAVHLERVPPRKVSRIPLGFEFHEMQPPSANELRALRQQMGLEGFLVIGTIGRLSKEKGHSYLFRALSQLRGERSTPWKLLVVGDGPLRTHLEQRAMEAGLRDQVIFTGFSEKPLAMIALMDLVAQPSLNEAFSRTMVEALALGKPLIISEVSGAREVVQDGRNGLIVPQADPGALAAAIRRLIDSPDLARAIGAQGARDVRAFTMERMAVAYEACYREVLDGPRHLPPRRAVVG